MEFVRPGSPSGAQGSVCLSVGSLGLYEWEGSSPASARVWLDLVGFLAVGGLPGRCGPPQTERRRTAVRQRSAAPPPASPPTGSCVVRFAATAGPAPAQDSCRSHAPLRPSPTTTSPAHPWDVVWPGFHLLSGGGGHGPRPAAMRRAGGAIRPASFEYAAHCRRCFPAALALGPFCRLDGDVAARGAPRCTRQRVCAHTSRPCGPSPPRRRGRVAFAALFLWCLRRNKRPGSRILMLAWGAGCMPLPPAQSRRRRAARPGHTRRGGRVVPGPPSEGRGKYRRRCLVGAHARWGFVRLIRFMPFADGTGRGGATPPHVARMDARRARGVARLPLFCLPVCLGLGFVPYGGRGGVQVSRRPCTACFWTYAGAPRRMSLHGPGRCA
ncbi:hypothetical protein PLESTB_000969400 [Pleodorina starrii]|uniref:Uncharacterized protein n=1 Tax=Pleodorina starrii TaxID=330485 RepID=A0A9W6BPC6_9CHLO|nr:hypothetical protein PLESTB_000969400 [Pleodorina starrii]GLC70947.1 hypothetical protein PLESTF_001053800 [Pleodorina starrii]